MAVNTSHPDRNSSNYILEALAAGLLFGIPPVFLKIASFNFYMSSYSVAAAVVSLTGFLLMQKSLYSGRVSIVISLITAASITTTFALSILVFNEFVSYLKWFGVAAIILGVADLVKK